MLATLVLVAATVVGAGRAADPDPGAIGVRSEAVDGRLAFVVDGIPPELVLRGPDGGAGWREVFPVFAGGGSDPAIPPLAGKYRVSSGRLEFLPAFPLEPGVTYRAEFRRDRLPGWRGDRDAAPVVHVVVPPAGDAGPPAEVAAVHPAVDRLPENLLKFYLHFSAPMARGEAYRRVALLDEQGMEVELPFLELSEEFWDPGQQRFTLFLDPGRVKRGLVPHEEEGRALEAGRSYTLVVDAAWRDAAGRPLARGFRKRFIVGPPDYRQPDPSGWEMMAPLAGSRDPLVVRFGEPLDHGLLGRMLDVVGTGKGGAPLGGTVAIGPEAREWRFVPDRPWSPGEHALVVDSRLEDLAGNSVDRLFETFTPDEEAAPAARSAAVRVRFEVAASGGGSASEDAPVSLVRWPHWRGPGFDGIARTTGLPVAWSADENVAWKSPLAADGASTPVAWGDRVVLTGQVGDAVVDTRSGDVTEGDSKPEVEAFVVSAFDLSSGEPVWEHRVVPEGEASPVHRLHNLATPSATTDGDAVVALFATGQLVCLDLGTGEPRWSRHLGEEVHPFDLRWGHSSSPVLDDGTLYVLCDHEPAACLLALDARTGSERWRAERGSGLRSYTTPVVAEIGGRRQVIVNSNPGIDAYAAATGEPLWSWREFCRVPVPMPVVRGDLVIASRGYTSGPFMVLRPPAGGVADEDDLLWRHASQAPYVSSLLVHENLVYASSESGRLLVSDLESGETLSSGKPGETFWSSPVAGDGHLYLLDAGGETIVTTLTAEPRIVSRNPLGEPARGSIAVAGRRLLIRTAGHLWCVGAP